MGYLEDINNWDRMYKQQEATGLDGVLAEVANLSVDVSANSSDIHINGVNTANNTSAIITNATNIAAAIQRANHTGTQLASTISDFNSASNSVIGGFSVVDDGYEIEDIDNNSVLSYDEVSDGDIVLHDNSNVPVSIGFRCKVMQSNTGNIRFLTAGTSTIKSVGSAVDTFDEGCLVEVIKIGTNAWCISGDLQ